MSEFYKGSVPCVTGQSVYSVVHPKINDPLSYPIVSLMIPASVTAGPDILGVTNKTTIGFDVVLTNPPTETGFAINWQINIPGTDIAEYVNDKRYYSKEEIGNAKLARVHWRNVIAAPDMTPAGLSKNHNHDQMYYTKQQLVPIIDARIQDVGSVTPIRDTLMLRDASGRSQANAPKVNADVANKGYVDVKVAGEAALRAAGDFTLQTQVTNISGSYATNAYVAQLEAQLAMLESLVANISSSGYYTGGDVPAGTIIWQASSASLGTDWGDPDGSLYAISGFGELFARIGYTFGGSGTHFAVPDIRGEFIRGWDAGRGLDSGRVFGSVQTSDNKLHTHGGSSAVSVADHSHTISPTPGNSSSTTSAASGSDVTVLTNTPGATATQAAGSHTHTINVSGDGSSEARPHNVALKPFIKLFTPYTPVPVNVETTQSISGQKTFVSPIIVPELPQAIIFGDPLTVGTQALGIIGGQMVISMYTSAAVWVPTVWLS